MERLLGGNEVTLQAACEKLPPQLESVIAEKAAGTRKKEGKT